MKVNYHNEDYKSVIFNIVVYCILIIFVIVWGICVSVSYNSFDIGLVIFCGIWIVFFIVLLFFAIKSYRSRKEKRNLNLFIMKNGKRIEGRVVSIYDNCTYLREIDMPRMHNVTAKISYTIDGEGKMVVVDRMCLNINKLKQYENKIVGIYVYNNMNYVDVVNGDDANEV